MLEEVSIKLEVWGIALGLTLSRHAARLDRGSAGRGVPPPLPFLLRGVPAVGGAMRARGRREVARGWSGGARDKGGGGGGGGNAPHLFIHIFSPRGLGKTTESPRAPHVPPPLGLRSTPRWCGDAPWEGAGGRRGETARPGGSRARRVASRIVCFFFAFPSPPLQLAWRHATSAPWSPSMRLRWKTQRPSGPTAASGLSAQRSPMPLEWTLPGPFPSPRRAAQWERTGEGQRGEGRRRAGVPAIPGWTCPWRAGSEVSVK